MPLKPENLSRRIVRDVADCTGAKPMQWVPIHTIARRLVLNDMGVVDRAIELAHAKGWLLIEAGHSICLTDEGQKLASSLRT